MTNKDPQLNGSADLHHLIEQLKALMISLDESSSSDAALPLIETLVAEADLIKLYSIKEIMPACVSALSFFQQNELPLDKQVINILTECFALIVKEAESAINVDPYDSYPQERDAILATLSVYVADSTGFELQYWEDVIVAENNLNAESAYMESIATEQSSNSKEPAEMEKNQIMPEPKPRKKIEKTKSKPEETTRVKSKLLAQLLSHSEELVQIRNALADISERQKEPRISELSSRLTSVSDHILNDLLKTRMSPIGVLLNKYKRIVRDLSLDLDKKVNLKIIGENIELDSNLIDAITEPLTHLVRNSIDHGIQSPAAREKAGKPEAGLLILHAYNESGKVVISICDDGSGVDREKVLEKAISSGLVSKDKAATLSPQEVLNMIFNAGLSTNKEVSSISGRGVGMDVVRRRVEEIKGEIELSSELGKGTQVLLRFPLTMATLKVSLFKINGVSYAIPSADITQIIRFSQQEEETSLRFDTDQPMLYRNDKIIPLLEPKAYLDGLNNNPTLKETYMTSAVLNIIVFRHEGKDWGLCVDEVFAYMDIVIKPMDRSMNPAELFAGLAVLGNGELAMIMSPKGLLKRLSTSPETGITAAL